MKYFSKFLIILAILLGSANFAFAKAAEFPSLYFDDVTRESSTIFEIVSIDELKELGIVDGYSDGSFKASNNINRAEFLKIVMESKNVEVSGSNCFKDVGEEWFASYVCSAVDLNIVDGYKDGTFRPAQNINFAEASKIIANAYGLIVEDQYDSNWFEKYVVAMEHYGSIPDSVIAFDQNITRGEMAYSVYLLSQDLRWPSYKNDRSYADVRALQDSGLDLKYMYGMEPNNLYTDGEKVYAVSYAELHELPGANPKTLEYFDEELTSIFFKDDDDIFALKGSYPADNNRLNVDYDSFEILAVDYDWDLKNAFKELDFDTQIGLSWSLLRDKDGLYRTGFSLYQSNITGEVENIADFTPYQCYFICGTDGVNFYHYDSSNFELKVLEGSDYESLSAVLTEEEVVVPHLIKDKKYVYEFRENNNPIILGGVEPDELEIIYYGGYDCSKYVTASCMVIYFSDGENVWFRDTSMWQDESAIIAGADPSDFDYETHLEKHIEDIYSY